MNKPLLDSKDILRTTNNVIAGIRSELHQSRKPAADERLLSVNRQIEELAKRKPFGDVYAVFALAAHLATEAIEAATELRRVHRADSNRYDKVLDFWHRVRDCNHAAALAAGGGNQTLAEALVTLQLLQNAGGGR